MSAFAWGLALLGCTSVVVGWVQYLATIQRDDVPRVPQTMFLAQGLGVALAASSVAAGFAGGGVPAGALAMVGFAAMMAAFFFGLYSQRKTPLGKLQVAVGEPMLAFEAMDSTGQRVSSDDWRGRRVLLKFFRGSW